MNNFRAYTCVLGCVLLLSVSSLGWAPKDEKSAKKPAPEKGKAAKPVAATVRSGNGKATPINKPPQKVTPPLTEPNSNPELAESPAPAPGAEPTTLRGGTQEKPNGKTPEKDNKVNQQNSDFDWFGFFIAFLCGVAVFVAVASFFWFTRRCNQLEARLKQPKPPQFGQNLDEIFAQLDETGRRLDEYGRYLKVQQTNYSDLQTQVLEMGDELKALRRNAANIATAASAAPVPRRMVDDGFEHAGLYAEPPSKPALTSAAEWLARARIVGTGVNGVLFRPESLQRAEDGEGIYLVTPDEKRRGAFVVLPNVPRFSSSQDYSHFMHFYDCDRPAAGELLIAEPALALYDKQRDEWKLSKRGRLQIA